MLAIILPVIVAALPTSPDVYVPNTYEITYEECLDEVERGCGEMLTVDMQNDFDFQPKPVIR